MGDEWTLLTSHGHVLIYLAAEADATIREITEALGISERRVSTIIHDLEAAGMLFVTKIGRRKHYEVNQEATFRHPVLSHVKLREVLDKLKPCTRAKPLRWRGR